MDAERFLAEHYPPGRGRRRKLRRKALEDSFGSDFPPEAIERAVRAIPGEGWFDERFYLRANPDVAESGMEPFLHYLRHGWREGRDPSDRFSVDFYAGTKFRDGEMTREPVLDFLLRGRDEGWSCHPWRNPGEENPPGARPGGGTNGTRRVLFWARESPGAEEARRTEFLRTALPPAYYRTLVLSTGEERAVRAALRDAHWLVLRELPHDPRVEAVLGCARARGVKVHFDAGCPADRADRRNWRDLSSPLVQTFYRSDQASVASKSVALLLRRFRIPVWTLPDAPPEGDVHGAGSGGKGPGQVLGTGEPGPYRRQLLWRRALRGGERADGDPPDEFAFHLAGGSVRAEAPSVVPHDVRFAAERHDRSRVTVIVPLFNYRGLVERALDSVRRQDLGDLDLVVVDDGSADDSVPVAEEWLRRHSSRFGRAGLILHRENERLGAARNTGVRFSATENFFPLDPDNRLRPECLRRCLAVSDRFGAAMTFPDLEREGEEGRPLPGGFEWHPLNLVAGNTIDAMALVRKEVWETVGGYSRDPDLFGWEDYDFWCKLAENGFHGKRVAEPLAVYRVHAGSLLSETTDRPGFRTRLFRRMKERHPWLELDEGD